MAIEVFNRYEKKYIIPNDDIFMKLYNQLSCFLEPDSYSKLGATYKITNLYYDTVDNRLIRSSMGKPAYKEKLRVRAYGVPDNDSTVYIEIKKKVLGLVNKRRSAMKLAEAYSFLDIGLLPEAKSYINLQVCTEIKTMLNRYSVKPALYLSYDRTAFSATGDDDVRVTFDENIITRRTYLWLESGSFGEPLLPDNTWLMEIKVKNNMPLWLSRLLSEYELYPTSFSKYGTEYKKMLTKNKTERILSRTS